VRRSRAFLALSTLVLLSSSCDEETLSPAPTIISLERGGYDLTFTSSDVTLVLSRGKEELARVDGAGLALGTVDTISPTASYDPWILLTDPESVLIPPELTFQPAVSARVLSRSDEGFAAELAHEGGQKSRLDVAIEADGRYRLSIVPLDPAHVAVLSVGAGVSPDEAYYGLGEYFDDVNHRGKLRAMQLEPAIVESGYNEAHVPVPLLLGTRGWGLFVESSRVGVFDVASSDPERVRTIFGMGEQAAEGLVFHLLAAQRPLDLTKLYYDITGYPGLPAPWALGPLVWRDENIDQAQVESDLDTMRDLDLATTGVWIDRPNATGVQTFDFKAEQFPDGAAMIEKAHDLGFRVGLWHAPYIEEENATARALHDEAEAAGYFPPQPGLPLNSWSNVFDFTNAAATAWWQDHLGYYRDLGIEGYKLDYAEDVSLPSVAEGRNVFRFSDGSDERTMHRGYTLKYHETYRAMLPETGGLLLCRAGRWGSQVYGPIIWPGDLDARMIKHGEPIEDDGKMKPAVGGLHASIVAGITLGPSGFPFYGADTGGYRHSPPDGETFRRWFEQTAFSSVMQIGTSSNDVAWEFGDPALLDSYREYTRWHLRLFPYTWTLAHQIAQTGYPIQRPIGLVEPELGAHPSDEYFFGDALLVAPVTEAGATSREVFFPSGQWVGFWDGTVIEGPTTADVSAPLGTLPLYLRAGAPLPLLRDTIDTLSPTIDPARVDSFATSVGRLWIRVAPGPEASLTMYDGTVLSQTTAGGRSDVQVTPGKAFSEGAIVELIGWGSAPPSSVAVGGANSSALASANAVRTADAGWFHDPSRAGGTVYVIVPPGGGVASVYR
jgi:alpha-D-xyloside xylohydrolase